MRTYTRNNVKVTYPENVVWLGDSNCVTIESMSTSDKVGAEIIIRHPAGVQTRTIRHLSELPRLLFVLDDALLALMDDNIGQYTAQVNVYNNGDFSFTRTFTFQLLDGKSFTNQSHAISRTIYIYDPTELVKLQVFSPQSGVFRIGQNTLPLTRGLNQFNLSSLITNYGNYEFCLEDNTVPPIAVISGDVANSPTSSTLYFSTVQGGGSTSAEVDGGDVWKYMESIFPVCYTLVYDEGCWNYDFVELMYKDCDGCNRYLGGKLSSETNKVSGSGYERTDGTNVYRNIPRRHIETTQRTIKVGFLDIAKNAYPQDILYSDEVYMRMYNTEWWPIVINDESITTNRDDNFDFELNITISKE